MSRQEKGGREELKRHIGFLIDSGNMELRRQFPGNKSNQLPDLISPYLANTIIDGEINSANFESSGYKRVQKEIEDYLGVKTIFQTCAHSDILPVNVIIPHATLSHRRLGGFTKTRETPYGQIELSDPVLANSVDTFINQGRRDRREARFVEYAGTHINTFAPETSCDQMTTAAVRDKRNNISKKIPSHGGLPVHFEDLDRGFNAFRAYVKSRKAESNTISAIYDTGSGMLIFGLKGVYDSKKDDTFNPEQSLRQNLVEMHNNGQILMAELLASKLRKTILSVGEANMLTMTHDYRDPRTLAVNIINSARIAKIVTEMERANNNFSWIPKQLREQETEWAIKALAFEAVYNITANEWLRVKHNRSGIIRGPSIVRAGPEGYPFNTGLPNAVEVAAPGTFGDQQASDILHLRNGDNTRIIFVTGRSEPASENIDPDEHFGVAYRQVRDNTKIIKERLAGRGEGTAVIGALYDSKQRMTHIIPTEN